MRDELATGAGNAMSAGPGNMPLPVEKAFPHAVRAPRQRFEGRREAKTHGVCDGLIVKVSTGYMRPEDREVVQSILDYVEVEVARSGMASACTPSATFARKLALGTTLTLTSTSTPTMAVTADSRRARLNRLTSCT